MIITAARLYVSPRTRALTPEEKTTRTLSYALKTADRPEFVWALGVAAPEMAALIDGPCNLVPIPSSVGSVVANRCLANQIAKRLEGARVIACLHRSAPVPSTCERHKARRGGLPVHQHNLVRDQSKWLDALPTYFVDNTTTSGNTLRAARKALGFGSGLVFSDAGASLRNHYERKEVCHHATL